VSRGAVLAGSTLPGPLVEDAIGRLFGVHAELPSQRPRRRPAGAAQRLAVALLVEAFRTAGLLSDRKYRVTASMRRTARRGSSASSTTRSPSPSAGAALGLDAAALVDTVRRRCA
jgi:hypothetical protein